MSERPLREGGDFAELLAKAKEGQETARPGSRERVWKAMQAPAPSSPLRWLVPVALAAAAGLAFFVLRAPVPPPEPELFATVTLSAGDVQASSAGGAWSAARVGQTLTEGAQFKVAGKSRAYTRLRGAGALYREGTRARLNRAHLVLDEGVIVAAAKAPLRAAAGAYVVDVESAVFQLEAAADAVTVYVNDGVAHVTGPNTDVLVRAGESWSSRAGAGQQKMAPSDVATARALAAASTDEAVLRILKPGGAQVSIDGVELGTTPLEVMAKVGEHQVSSVQGSLRTTTRAVVAASGGLDLELPAPEALPLPEVTFEPGDAMPESRPQGGHLTLPTDPEKRYLLARRHAQTGRYVDAIALYDDIAGGKSGWAEPSQYEIGRLQLRGLKDPARAIAALDAYRRRWPNGSLAHEVALSEIEAQLKLKAPDAALKEMDDFLSRFRTSERSGDVRFLRATLRRDRGDCEGATADYLALLDDPAHGDDALYFAAVCEQQLGDETLARRHLTEYLQRFPAGTHRADVKRFFEGGR